MKYENARKLSRRNGLCSAGPVELRSVDVDRFTEAFGGRLVSDQDLLLASRVDPRSGARGLHPHLSVRGKGVGFGLPDPMQSDRTGRCFHGGVQLAVVERDHVQGRAARRHHGGQQSRAGDGWFPWEHPAPSERHVDRTAPPDWWLPSCPEPALDFLLHGFSECGVRFSPRRSKAGVVPVWSGPGAGQAA